MVVDNNPADKKILLVDDEAPILRCFSQMLSSAGYTIVTALDGREGSETFEREKYKSVDECYNSLRKEGFRIFASQVSVSSKNIYDLDYTGNTAIILGNENRGISEEAAKFADERFVIPMHGMVQSLNVSVSAAITIYEAVRQRRLKGMYEQSDLSDEQIEKEINKWSKK